YAPWSVEADGWMAIKTEAGHADQNRIRTLVPFEPSAPEHPHRGAQHAAVSPRGELQPRDRLRTDPRIDDPERRGSRAGPDSRAVRRRLLPEDVRTERGIPGPPPARGRHRNNLLRLRWPGLRDDRSDGCHRRDHRLHAACAPGGAPVQSARRP